MGKRAPAHVAVRHPHGIGDAEQTVLLTPVGDDELRVEIRLVGAASCEASIDEHANCGKTGLFFLRFGRVHNTILPPSS